MLYEETCVETHACLHAYVYDTLESSDNGNESENAEKTTPPIGPSAKWYLKMEARACMYV